MGRFITGDDYPATGQGLTGNNMFAYCGNNPVLRKDESGAFWNIAAGAVIGGILSAVTQIAANIATDKDWYSGLAVATISGAASGALSATGFGKAAQVVGNAAISFAGEALNQMVSGTWGTEDGNQALFRATIAGGIGGLIGGNGMRHKTSNYYKAAQSAKATAEKVFSKFYTNPQTPAKLLGRAIKMVKTVGYSESVVTGVKFLIGSVNAQIMTRFGTE
jgi:hypothetical protein